MLAFRPRTLVLAAITTAATLLISSCAFQHADEVIVTVTPGQVSTPVVVSAPPLGSTPAGDLSVRTAAPTSTGNAAPTVPRVVATPAFGSTDVGPTQPIKVNVLGGTIKSVDVTADDGGKITGEVAADKRTFTVTERLRYGTTYTFKGVTASADGAEHPLEGTLATIKPESFVEISSAVQKTQKYGVGQPFIIFFKPAITDKAAAEQALKVSTDKGEIEGSWGWLQDEDIDGKGVLKSQVQFRPKDPWPAHTKVTVNAAFYGVDMGNGWGSEDLTMEMNIDRKLVVQADVPSHHMVVMIDDKVWKNFPVSYGAPRDDRDTTTGRHLVQAKHADYKMSSPRYGYSNVPVKWAVRINNNGEFIHENQAVADSGYLGVQNVSHGCINMSEADAHEFYDAVLLGDIVDITGTNTPMSERDWNYVWKYSWDEWKGLSKAH